MTKVNLQCQAVQPSLELNEALQNSTVPTGAEQQRGQALSSPCGHGSGILALKQFPLGISFPKPTFQMIFTHVPQTRVRNESQILGLKQTAQVHDKVWIH